MKKNLVFNSFVNMEIPKTGKPKSVYRIHLYGPLAWIILGSHYVYCDRNCIIVPL